MDNRSHEEATWNDDILKSELLDLSGFDIDLELTGFGLDEISSFLDSSEPEVGLIDEDDAPPLPDEPISKPGDLWILGSHRLLCGDATNAADIERLMDGVYEAPFSVGTPASYFLAVVICTGAHSCNNCAEANNRGECP
jgi:hypothetical protein